MNALEASLRRLQSDHIDLYYVHQWDDTTPIEETLRALDDLIRMGKVRYIAASRFSSWQLASANNMAEFYGWSPFVALQSQYNMLERKAESELLPYCRAHNVGFVPYYPLAAGFLTGKYKRGLPPPAGSRGEKSKSVKQYMTEAYYRKVERLEQWAKDHGRGLNELALAWLAAQAQVCSIISGATELDHVLNNAKAADWKLTAEEREEINTVVEDI
jgi:aryl-alcohol dehydrogenase-like predicted oxidoreductase